MRRLVPEMLSCRYAHICHIRPLKEASPSQTSDQGPAVLPASGFSAVNRWAKPWIVLVLFAAIGFATYFPCLKGGRIWDDNYLIGENPFFRSPVFSLEVFRQHLFSESFSAHYRPVQNLSYMWDYGLCGENSAGYHCTNVLIHCMAAWLLFFLLRGLLPGLWKGAVNMTLPAMLIALLWLVHPVHNAAVAYISGRADSLAALFAIGAWIIWRGSCERKRVASRMACRLAAAALFLFALCSKEIALVWALLFTLHALFFEERLSRKDRMLSIAGLIAVIMGYAVLHALPAHRAGVFGVVAEPFGGRMVLALRALGDYCGLMLAPVRLMMERSLGNGDLYSNRATWWRGVGVEYLSIMGVCALAVSVWLWMRRGEARSLRRFGLVWFFVSFVPISNLIPLNAEVAEHWIYTASIGFILLMAGTVPILPQGVRRLAVPLSLAAAAALAVRTSFRAADWVDGEAFAERTIADGGGTARLLAYYANELGRKGKFAEQEQVYRKTLTIYPDFMTARIGLGVCLQRRGCVEEAEPLLDIGRAGEVLPNVPRNWNAALNLAGQLHKDGKSVEALALVREWRPMNRDTWELAGFEANVLHETEGPLAALTVVAEYASAHWWHLPSQLGLASLQREAGDDEGALQTARKAQGLDIRGAAAYFETAKCEVSLGRLSDALESQAVAVSRAPDNRGYLDFFSAILNQLGRTGEAMAVHRKSETVGAGGRKRLL